MMNFELNDPLNALILGIFTIAMVKMAMSILDILFDFNLHQQDEADPNTFVPTSTAEEDEIGIAHAGGSLRAFSSSYGVLRGFEQKGVMDLVKYNSGISGGSIPSILYTYAGVNTKDLLETDRLTDPSKITDALLDTMPKSSMGYVIAEKPDSSKIMLSSILKTLVNPVNYFKIHSLWTASVYKKTFEPLRVPKNKFFTSSKEELKNILKENPRLNEKDFILPRKGTKTLPMILYTMQGCRADFFLYEKNYKTIYSEAWKKFHDPSNKPMPGKPPIKSMTDIILEIRDQYGSNLVMPYVTTPDCVENKYNGSVQIRSKVVNFPERNVRPFEWGAKKGAFGRDQKFSVELLAGMSTNFPSTSGIRDPEWYRALPAMLLTALRKIYIRDNSTMTLRFADGGSSDVAGILPLVARGTKNIICVYNFNQGPLCDLSDSYAKSYKASNGATSMQDSKFDQNFQDWLKMINERITCYFGHFGPNPIVHANIMNHVFEDDIDRLKELMIKFNSLYKAGEPLIATLKGLKVIDNPFWGITGGKTVNLTFMYYNMPKKFSLQVPPSLGGGEKNIGKKVEGVEGKDEFDGRFTCEEFKNVPELPVNGTEATKYTVRQINMMGYLGSWMIDRSWKGLKDSEGEVMFEGFEKIFHQQRQKQLSEEVLG